MQMKHWGLKMIDINLIKNNLNYCKLTGTFTWKNKRKGRRKFAGYIEKSTGYLRICINKKKYYAHRLAWVFVYGYEPNFYIDHIDCNKLNNLISNLREANYFENAQNVGITKNNKSGYKGVSYFKRDNNWTAQCKYLGVTYYLGRYKTAIEAKKVYDNFVLKHNKDFANISATLYPDISLRLANEALGVTVNG